VLYLAINRKVVIAIPTTGSQIVAGSENHKLLWGRYYIDLLTNFSKNDIDTRTNILLTFVRNQLTKENLLKEAEEVKRSDITQVFVPYESTWQVQGDVVSVKGNLKRFVGTTLVRNEDVIVKVKLRYTGATVELEDWKYEKP
ncbi:MAG: type IV conjugative transfer system protein TraE, partial [Nitrosotalea sp.]